MRAKQGDFFSGDREVGPRRLSHGGDLGRGKRKTSRPLDSKKSLHLTLKSTHAKGALSMLGVGNRLKIERIVRARANQYKITIHGFENMGNHIHLLISFKTRAMFQSFLRVVSGLIARHVTKAKKGRPFGKRFFDNVAFSRVVNGARDFKGLISYFFKNEIERELVGQVRAQIEKNERESRKLRARVRSKEEGRATSA